MSSCDSGGPLFNTTGTNTVVGITSFRQNDITHFARIANVRLWLASPHKLDVIANNEQGFLLNTNRRTAVVDCDHVLFAYAEKHTQDFVKKLFGGFAGFLQSDASNVYDILDRGPPSEDDEAVTLVGCWAHCRRYFFEAAICKHAIGVQGLLRIRAIYAADDSFRKLPPAQRKVMRDTHVRPLMVSFFEWVKATRHVTQGRSLATKALSSRRDARAWSGDLRSQDDVRIREHHAGRRGACSRSRR